MRIFWENLHTNVMLNSSQAEWIKLKISEYFLLKINPKALRLEKLWKEMSSKDPA